jgi:hypothetical protein
MRVWLARMFIGIVLFFNIQCVVLFWLQPQKYAPAYELLGEAGIAAVQGFGVLFLMWNIPYFVAFWNPLKNRLSVWEAIAMQTVGVIGETLILQSLPPGHAVLRLSISRFIGFDGVGLLLLLAGAYLSRSQNPRQL